MPKFSIIIPCYNCLATLPDTLTSCLQQKNHDFEIIIIDDCSKERLESVYEYFSPIFLKRNIRLRYHRNPTNLGVSFSRNAAWDLAVGEYVCFLDSDDIWHNSKLEIVSDFLDGNNCNCLYHSYTHHKSYFFMKHKYSDYTVKKISLISLMLKNPSQTSCFILRRSLADRFDVNMRYSEDYDLWLRISNTEDIYHLHGSPLTLLGRPQKTLGGLSGNRKGMRCGELIAYSKFTKLNKKFRVLLPLLLLYSILKHIRSECKFFWRL